MAHVRFMLLLLLSLLAPLPTSVPLPIAPPSGAATRNRRIIQSRSYAATRRSLLLTSVKSLADLYY
uniref:Uncharacterized protein n=1 Tax=Pristionchus pacificus TaxID=54126 RepID=A0A2A6B9J7_PRIPA|eukprot:PDM62531.1 hypothetical protein PRIPAC_51973 [Pristionchus pacificus]